jgi:uncharacterized protein (DUF697 family)
MDPRVARLVHRTGLVNAAIGAVLSPIPLADELILFPIFGWMTSRIARIHALSDDRIPWQPIRATRVAALVARAGLNVTVAYIPGVAAFANAVSAFAVTELVGRYVDKLCTDPESAQAMTVQEIVQKLREKLARGRKVEVAPSTT